MYHSPSPKCFSRLYIYPMQYLLKTLLESKENRGAGFGLKIPLTYIGTGIEKALTWIQGKISEEIINLQ